MYFSTRPRGITPVTAHEGSAADFLRRHESEARTAAKVHGPAREKFLSALFDRLTDSRNLLLAPDYVCRKGGTAPGPDGISPDELDRRARVQLASVLRDVVRSGADTPGPARQVPIPKANGG